ESGLLFETGPPMFQRFWRPETGIFLGIWLVLLVGGRSGFFRDSDTLWHTMAGEQMVASGHLITSDSFSFTMKGEKWIPHQWLAECLMALMHRIGGLDTLLLGTVALLASLYTCLAHPLICAGVSWALAVRVIALTLGTGASHFLVRPHIVPLLCFAWTYAWLVDFEAGRIGLGRLFWLVPVYAVWTNLHGGMLGGLATIGLAT